MRKEYTDHNLNPSKELSSNEPKDNCLDGHDFRKAINNPYVGNLKGKMTVKDLFAMCDREKLMPCIATKHEDVPDGVDIMEAVPLPASFLTTYGKKFAALRVRRSRSMRK